MVSFARRLKQPGSERWPGIKVKLVIPGVRSAGLDKDDQKAWATPKEAMRAGANYLVIGRAGDARDGPARPPVRASLKSSERASSRMAWPRGEPKPVQRVPTNCRFIKAVVARCDVVQRFILRG